MKRPRCGSQIAFFANLAALAMQLAVLHGAAFADDTASRIRAALAAEVIAPETIRREIEDLVVDRAVPWKLPGDPNAWPAEADALRRRVLDEVVYRGHAQAWRDARGRVEWLDTFEPAPDYVCRKLRFEAVPGLWIPAILYLPRDAAPGAPAVLSVHGHDRQGNAAPYKQLLCINLAKRGVVALSIDWLGMGQLTADGFAHGRMNQIELAGASGLAPFYLILSRAIDLLVELPEVDRQRVAVTGLSGGGWQSILLGALDPRVALTCPVAGYAGIATNVRNDDFGDSEQMPRDLARVADYLQLTALCAPRPLLLVYNSADDCCFRSAHALPPLRAVAEPLYAALNAPDRFAWHVNDEPGTHNYERENREAFYRFVRRHFFPGEPAADARWPADEIPSESEVRTAEQLAVPLPDEERDLHQLAAAFMAERPTLDKHARATQAAESAADGNAARAAIAEHLGIGSDRPLRAPVAEISARVASPQNANTAGRWFRATLAEGTSLAWWFAECPGANQLRVFIGDDGSAAMAGEVATAFDAGQSVAAVDVLPFGQARVQANDLPTYYLLALDCVGRRPLALMAEQLHAALADLRGRVGKEAAIELVARGPRASYLALLTLAVWPDDAVRLRARGGLGSLAELIERDRLVDFAPELFSFDLLNQADIPRLVALVGKNRVTLDPASPGGESPP